MKPAFALAVLISLLLLTRLTWIYGLIQQLPLLNDTVALGATFFIVLCGPALVIFLLKERLS